MNILIGAQVFCWPKIINPLGHVGTRDESRNAACSGKRLDCAIERMKSMDPKKNLTEAFTIDMTEPLRIYEKQGSIPKPSVSFECLPACKVQENFNQMSSALYPYKDNFFHQERFCDVASHILQVTCQDENRKYFLDLQQPDFCQTLEYFENYFNANSTCQNWPYNFLHVFKKPTVHYLKKWLNMEGKTLL